MAEFVQAGLEGMLDEIQQLKRVQLLSNEEVKEVIKKRKNFEYKLQKREKQKEDILSYIQFESCLLHLIGIRREQSKYTNKKDEIDHAMARRINKLFRILEHRFSGDLKIWSSHIAFLEKIRWNESISKIYRRMLQVHPEKVKLWISAARSEMSFGKGDNFENARTLLMEAIRFHPKSQDLFLESFCLELIFLASLRDNASKHLVAEDSKGLILDGKIAETIFKKGYEVSCEDVVERLTLTENCLRLCEDLKGPIALKRNIVSFLEEKMPTEPETWDLKGRLCLIDFTNVTSLEGRSKFDKLKECCQAYEQGLKKSLPADIPVKRKRLLALYISTLRRLLETQGMEKTHLDFLTERLYYGLSFGHQSSILDLESEILLKSFQ